MPNQLQCIYFWILEPTHPNCGERLESNQRRYESYLQQCQAWKLMSERARPFSFLQRALPLGNLKSVISRGNYWRGTRAKTRGKRRHGLCGIPGLATPPKDEFLPTSGKKPLAFGAPRSKQRWGPQGFLMVLLLWVSDAKTFTNTALYWLFLTSHAWSVQQFLDQFHKACQHRKSVA